jgi:UDP-2,3-diacylglucosamine hydrolase
MRGVFISDLHLFSQRSVGQGHWESIAPRLFEAECVVLGGDIFDFRWSRLGSFEHSLSAAHSWLERAVDANPNARWIYVMGNHDCQPEFGNRLEQMALRHHRFRWHPSHWRLGDHLFLHGDLLEGRGSPQEWSRFRRRFHEVTPRGALGNALYRVAVGTRMHDWPARLRHRPERMCRSIVNRVGNWHPTLLDGLRHVVFGHTHVPLSKWRHGSLDFHNAGSGIRHLEFNPIWFEIN